ncbi:hypothetical protein [Flavobacterium microcysteis]
MSNHGNTERHIVELFNKCAFFEFEGDKYEIKVVGKPRPSKGECKTDVYILAQEILTKKNKEIKISIKQNDADFLENKMSYSRAIEIFGNEAKDILIKSIKSVERSFLDDNLVYFHKHKRTEAKCIKIGWKFELINKYGGERSGALLMSNDQKIDVYSGANLNESKKNAKVGNTQIPDSGIANYILEVDTITHDINYYVKKLIPIEEYAVKQDLFFACKALNYRAVPNKWDGDRPLSVFIEWTLEDKLVKAKFNFDRPLEIKGNEVGLNIRRILRELKIDCNNFGQLANHLDKSIKTI